jgi:hypothetical protein
MKSDLAVRRVTGMKALDCAVDAHHGSTAGTAREQRMDDAREREVLQRQQQAMREHVARLDREADLPRVLLIHRQPWFCDRFSAAASLHGLSVVGTLDNGADAVGIAVAEQPEVVVLEEHVAMQTSAEVLRALRTYCPSTKVVVQVETNDAVGEFLDHGADEVVTRRLPAADVAALVLDLIKRASSG